MIRRGATSLPLRLAVVSALIAAVVLSALGALVAMQLHDAALRTVGELAADDLRPFAVDLREHPEEQPDPSATGVFVLVEAPDGRVRRNSMPGALAGAARRIDRVGDVEVDRGSFRVVAQTVATSTGTWRLWAARDLTASTVLQQGVLTTLLVGIPLAVLLIGVAAWAVASGALRPVARMSATAERLRADASGTLPVQGGRQLSELATTLNTLIEDLRASAAHERRVTADAAHELRTPIAVLSAQIELAQRGSQDPRLDPIRTSVDRLSRTADSLLALARAEGAAPAGAATAVAALLTEAMDAVDRFRLLADPAVSVDLELGQPLDEGARVAMDTAGFGRVLANLVGNALAAGPASAVLIRIESDEHHLHVRVEDDGPGVPPGFLPFAFDRFSRPPGGVPQPGSGAGLGLALVRRLVEQAGGAVGLRNGESGGAVVELALPLRTGAQGDPMRL